ncbi:MAG TPA: BadF/BadG/BcrA/BcrD ATPase family protein [Bryobacteraceae bacterium]|nr:BadF/BadG/BcrA/BcrD ATPase family protein [Bryobacteraceae bacterium]
MLFLGVDGGQSSTTALIADESGRVLGMGSAGPCNHVGGAEARGKFLQAMAEALAGACRQAGLDTSTVAFRAACLGFSGGAHDKAELVREAIRADHFDVSDDAVIALAGATEGEPGIITIGGTGSISLGRNAAGKRARAGGWGYLFGDEGGAFDLTRQAVRAILRLEEGWGSPTALLPMLLRDSGTHTANELMHRMYTPEFPRPRIAGLSKLVNEAAENGDGVAIQLLHRAAQELATITGAVRQQLFDLEEPVRIAYIGGVFRSGILRARFCELAALHDGVRVGPPVYGPAAGALLEAFRAAGLHPTLTNLPEEKS